MKKYTDKFIAILKGKKAKQVGSLYSTMILGMVVGVGNSIINTRFLGPKLYGDFRFIMSLYNFVVMFITIGVFFSGSRLLAQKKNQEKEPWLKGTMMTYAAVASLLMIIGFVIFSFFEDRIYDNNLGVVIRLFSPFLFVFPFRLCLEGIMTGSNQIYKLSMFRLFPKGFYLVAALLVNFMYPLTLKIALLLNLSSFAVITIIMVVALKPKFNRLKEHWRMILTENKSYGFPVYISHLANTATMRIAALTIAYFVDTVNVGYYTLALTVTLPLSMIPRVVGTTFFKDFANRDSIPLKATLATTGLALAAWAGFVIMIKYVFFIIYTKDFSPALPVIYLLSVSSLIHGFADFVNRFLGAHGKGKDMRSSAFIVAVFNIAGYSLLVKYFLLDGAVITRITASVVYFLTMLYFYKKLRGELKLKKAEANPDASPSLENQRDQ